MDLLVSLTTIPPRFALIKPMLESVLRQTAKIEEIRLYIPQKYRRFPDYDGSLPEVPKGVRIIQTKDDLGPATKVLFAAQDLRGCDVAIIYCDDDRVYEADRFARMKDIHLNGRQDECIAPYSADLETKGLTPTTRRQPRAIKYQKDWAYRRKRARQMFQTLVQLKSHAKPRTPLLKTGGYVDFAMGVGGVLVRPDFFDENALNIPDVLWSVDDIWLSGLLEAKGIKIWSPAQFYRPGITKGEGQDALYNAIIDGADRDTANLACIKFMQETYRIWQ